MNWKIYVARDASGFVKVGRSRRPENRIRDLRWLVGAAMRTHEASPPSVELERTIDAAPGFELYLHWLLEPWRSRHLSDRTDASWSEWYRDEGDFRNVLNSALAVQERALAARDDRLARLLAG